jgi:hypothetical protein
MAAPWCWNCFIQKQTSDKASCLRFECPTNLPKAGRRVFNVIAGSCTYKAVKKVEFTSINARVLDARGAGLNGQDVQDVSAKVVDGPTATLTSVSFL